MPSLNPSFFRASFSERAAVNAPIQGSAADLIKLAMIAIHKALESAWPQALMILQVHDELVLDVPERDLAAVEACVREKMEGVMSLRVPLRVDVHVGDSWYKAN